MATLRDIPTNEIGHSDRDWAKRVRDAELDYLRCLAEFGCDSGEAYSALWHLRQMKRLSVDRSERLVAA